jgi:hypothetical protein
MRSSSVSTRVRLQNNRLVILIAIIIASAVCPRVSANNLDFDINSDYEMDRRYDWTMDVKVTNAKNYLNYAGSRLKPLVKLSISYRMNPRFSKAPTKFIDYEELWYQEGRAVGCRRLHNLDIPGTYQGALRVVPSPDADEHSEAVSGAIPRLVLDLALRNCVISMLFVPKDIFYNTISGLSRYNFYQSTSGAAGATSIHLLFVSNPLGFTQTVDYRS